MMPGLDPNPIYDETAWRHGFAPMPDPERLPGDRDELVRVVYTGHGIGHAYRDDFRVVPL